MVKLTENLGLAKKWSSKLSFKLKIIVVFVVIFGKFLFNIDFIINVNWLCHFLFSLRGNIILQSSLFGTMSTHACFGNTVYSL